jgi:ferredoxin
VQVRVEYEKCIASGSCVLACPEVFAQDDEGVVVVLDEQPDEALRESVQEAADSCPAVCIAVED